MRTPMEDKLKVKWYIYIIKSEIHHNIRRSIG